VVGPASSGLPELSFFEGADLPELLVAMGHQIVRRHRRERAQVLAERLAQVVGRAFPSRDARAGWLRDDPVDHAETQQIGRGDSHRLSGFGCLGGVTEQDRRASFGEITE
jgi:hypothetical protein